MQKTCVIWLVRLLTVVEEIPKGAAGIRVRAVEVKEQEVSAAGQGMNVTVVIYHVRQIHRPVSIFNIANNRGNFYNRSIEMISHRFNEDRQRNRQTAGGALCSRCNL